MNLNRLPLRLPVGGYIIAFPKSFQVHGESPAVRLRMRTGLNIAAMKVNIQTTLFAPR